MVGVGDGVMLGEGVKLGVALGPKKEVGLILHAPNRESIHNPKRSFLKSMRLLIMGNEGTVNLMLALSSNVLLPTS